MAKDEHGQENDSWIPLNSDGTFANPQAADNVEGGAEVIEAEVEVSEDGATASGDGVANGQNASEAAQEEVRNIENALDGAIEAQEGQSEPDDVYEQGSEEKVQAQAPRGQETLILTDEMVMTEPGEAQEGVERPMEAREPSDGGMKTETHSEGTGVVRTESETIVATEMPKKSSKKGLIITLVLTLVLAVVAIATWYFLAGLGKNS